MLACAASTISAEQLRLIEPSLHPVWPPRRDRARRGRCRGRQPALFSSASERPAPRARREGPLCAAGMAARWSATSSNTLRTSYKTPMLPSSRTYSFDGFDDGDRLLPAPHRRSLPAPMLSRADARRVRYAVGYEQDVAWRNGGAAAPPPRMYVPSAAGSTRAQRGGVGAVDASWRSLCFRSAHACLSNSPSGANSRLLRSSIIR